jgi:hypothetical protein
LLEQAGYEATDDAADADVVVINTCSVREHAEDKLYAPRRAARDDRRDGARSDRRRGGLWRAAGRRHYPGARAWCDRCPRRHAGHSAAADARGAGGRDQAWPARSEPMRRMSRSRSASPGATTRCARM